MIHLARDLVELKKEILILGSMVEEAINKSIVALVKRRADLSKEVVDGDTEIDTQELKVEDMSTKILALHQPVAGDLRFIITVLKVNSYLERMGDLASNIAERSFHLSTHEPLDVPDNFLRMADLVRQMVRESLDSLVNGDVELAYEVGKQDDEVDDINREMYKVMQEKMMNDNTSIKRAVNVLSTSYQLERIADLSSNIAEDVIYMVTGDVIRHRASLIEAQQE